MLSMSVFDIDATIREILDLCQYYLPINCLSTAQKRSRNEFNNKDRFLAFRLGPFIFSSHVSGTGLQKWN